MPHIARLRRGVQPLGVALTAYFFRIIQKNFQIARQIFPVLLHVLVEQGNSGNDDGISLIRKNLQIGYGCDHKSLNWGFSKLFFKPVLDRVSRVLYTKSLESC